MELHILMGRACAGKSRRVLEQIAARRSERGQVLLVPEHASHEAELDLCRVCGPTASRDAEVLSFRSLATRVLSRTGGLADTVKSCQVGQEDGTGYLFESYDAGAMLDVIGQATGLYRGDRAGFDTVRRRGMTADFSWARSAGDYRRIYENLLG